MAIKIDCDGLGGTLASFLANEGYKVVRIGAGTNALDKEAYPNRRSELFFTVAEKAWTDELDLSRLPEEVLDEMHRQAMSITWSFDSRGRRVVMPKDEMRLPKNMGRSPDTLDALNLAHAVAPTFCDAMPEILTTRRKPVGRRYG